MSDNNGSNDGRDQETRECKQDGASQRQRRQYETGGANRLGRERRRSRSLNAGQNQKQRHRSLQSHQQRGENPRSKSRRREGPEDDRSEVKRQRVGSNFDKNPEEPQRQIHGSQRLDRRSAASRTRGENYKPQAKESDDYVKMWKEKFNFLREEQVRAMNNQQMVAEVFRAIEELNELIHRFSEGYFPMTDNEGRIQNIIDEQASGNLTESDRGAMRRVTADRRKFIQATVKSQGDKSMNEAREKIRDKLREAVALENTFLGRGSHVVRQQQQSQQQHQQQGTGQSPQPAPEQQQSQQQHQQPAEGQSQQPTQVQLQFQQRYQRPAAKQSSQSQPQQTAERTSQVTQPQQQPIRGGGLVSQARLAATQKMPVVRVTKIRLLHRGGLEPLQEHTKEFLQNTSFGTMIGVKSSGDKKSFTVTVGGHATVTYAGPFAIDAKLTGWEEFKVIIYAQEGTTDYPIKMYSYEAVENEVDMHESEGEDDYVYDRSKEGWEAFIRSDSSKRRQETDEWQERQRRPQQCHHVLNNGHSCPVSNKAMDRVHSLPKSDSIRNSNTSNRM